MSLKLMKIPGNVLPYLHVKPTTGNVHMSSTRDMIILYTMLSTCDMIILHTMSSTCGTA